jgi:hypothetical protein
MQQRYTQARPRPAREAEPQLTGPNAGQTIPRSRSWLSVRCAWTVTAAARSEVLS